MITAREVVDAKKNPIASGDIESVLKDIPEVCIARGKSFSCTSLTELRQDPKAFGKMFGPSDNLRAPSIIVDDKLVVGFNQEMYDGVFND